MTTGDLAKLDSRLESPVAYALRVGDASIALNPSLGQRLTLRHTGSIHCLACGRTTRKSFNQGYCFPCFRKLAVCDLCVVRPERCHYHQGTCREPRWGESHCMRPHVVYLANSSGLKVGITRDGQIPTRWIDQGAVQAIPVFRVESRYHAGLIEHALSAHVADRTDWRRMLMGEVAVLELRGARDHLLSMGLDALSGLKERLDPHELEVLEDAAETVIEYPVLEPPPRLTSLSLDKTPTIEGTLLGIKGQYLIFDHGVLNVRKFSGYEVETSLSAAGVVES